MCPPLPRKHPITDYSNWRGAFDAFASVRRDAGVIAERVARPVDDPASIVVALDFETVDQASSLLHFLETQVWPSTANGQRWLVDHERRFSRPPPPDRVVDSSALATRWFRWQSSDIRERLIQ